MSGAETVLVTPLGPSPQHTTFREWHVMAAHHPITVIRVGNRDVEITPDTKIVGADGNDWAWAYVVFGLVEGYPDYRVGTDGSAWSQRPNYPCLSPKPWKRLKFRLVSKGKYRDVTVCNDSGQAGVMIHRVVLGAFLGDCPTGMEGCHNNGNSHDNRISNLRWDTRVRNHADKKKHGTHSVSRLPRNQGSRHGLSKLTESDVAEMRRIKAEHGTSARQIAFKFGVSPSLAQLILNGKRWKHVQDG
jgi:hypothetical protein